MSYISNTTGIVDTVYAAISLSLHRKKLGFFFKLWSYSDYGHSVSQQISLVSKTKHARVVEKQFTVDKIFRMRWRVSGPVVPNCLPNVTFYRRDLVLVTIFFVMSTVHPNIAQLRKNNHIMLPNVRQQVVQFSSLPSSLCKTNS